MSEPSMIDQMSEHEVRSACKELSIDCERKRKRITELESRLIAHGICPKCDAQIVCDYRAGKATNHRCKCGWKAIGEGNE